MLKEPLKAAQEMANASSPKKKRLMPDGGGTDLFGRAAEDADFGARPGDGLVEVVEPPPRLLPGHEPGDVDHLAAAAKVRHLLSRRLRRLRLSQSLPLPLPRCVAGDAWVLGGVRVCAWGRADEAEARSHWRCGGKGRCGAWTWRRGLAARRVDGTGWSDTQTQEPRVVNNEGGKWCTRKRKVKTFRYHHLT